MEGGKQNTQRQSFCSSLLFPFIVLLLSYVNSALFNTEWLSAAFASVTSLLSPTQCEQMTGIGAQATVKSFPYNDLLVLY